MANNPPNRWRDQFDITDAKYTATTAADWDGATAPSGPDTALDQVAERIKDVEEGGRAMPYLVGAEAADVINVAIAVTDADGNAVTGAEQLLLTLYTDAVLWTHATGATNFDVSAGTNGTLDSQVAGEERWRATTNAAGLIDVNITDIVGASGATVYLRIQYLETTGLVYRRAAETIAVITFD